MARDPDEGGAFVFDLVDDDGDAPSAPLGPDAVPYGAGPDGDEPGAADLPPHRVLGASLGPFAPVAAVLAVVLGTVFAVDGLRDAERIERIREVPGGVVDVSEPLREVWTWEGQVGSQDWFDGFGIADLQGVLAFRSGEELVGLDPASGDRAWSVPLGVNPDCGPAGHPGLGGDVATSVLVCVQGTDAAREAVVVRPDGVASQSRRLDPADDRRYGTARPGPDGTVLRARRIGSVSVIDAGDARCVEATGECSGTVPAGRDLLVRAEDALTGEVRWSLTIPFRAAAAQECAAWFGAPWNGWADVSGDEVLAPDMFGARIEAGLVDLWGCGIGGSVTPDGVPLRISGEPGVTRTISLGGGRYASLVDASTSPDSVGTTHTTLFGPGGAVVGEVPGYVSRPRTTDDPDATTLFGSSGSGSFLHSYTADGTERWAVEIPDGPSEILAEVAGTAVTSTWNGTVRGLDLATGAERWTWEPGETGGTQSFGYGFVSQAFTDGRFVLLLLQVETGGLAVASLDAVSGEVAWDRTAMADELELPQDASLLSVGGHLLAVSPAGVSGLG